MEPEMGTKSCTTIEGRDILRQWCKRMADSVPHRGVTAPWLCACPETWVGFCRGLSSPITTQGEIWGDLSGSTDSAGTKIEMLTMSEVSF